MNLNASKMILLKQRMKLVCYFIGCLFAFLGAYIYYFQVQMNTHFGRDDFFYFGLICFLMPINICLESFKFKFCLPYKITFIESIQKICKGFAFELFIPFGLGSYIGRVTFEDKKHIPDLIALSSISSLIQTTWNVLFGFLLGFPFMLSNFILEPFTLWNGLSISLAILFFLNLLFYLLTRTEFLQFLKSKWPEISKLEWSLMRFKKKDYIIISGLSLLRYLVYLLQIAVALVFVSEVHFLVAVNTAAIFLMLVSMIYLPGFLSTLSRAAIAVLVFSYIGIGQNQSISVSWLIYLLNVGIPAMFGFYFLLNHIVQRAK